MTDPVAQPSMVPTFGTVRIFCSDGAAFDVALPVPWDHWIASLINVGAIIHANCFINRQYIVRVHRFPESGGLPPDLGGEDGKVVPLSPIKR